MYTFSSRVLEMVDIFTADKGEYVATVSNAAYSENPVFFFKLTKLTKEQLAALITEFDAWKYGNPASLI